MTNDDHNIDLISLRKATPTTKDKVKKQNIHILLSEDSKIVRI